MFPLSSAAWIKIAAIAGIILFSYYKGYLNEHEKFVAFQSEVSAIGKAQEVKNADIVKQHNQITENIKNDYEDKLAALDAAYSSNVVDITKRVQQPNASSNSLPTVSKPTRTIVRTITDPLFARACAETTLQLSELQKWVQGQLNVK